MFKVGLFLICFLQRHRVAPNSKDRTGDQASGIGMAARVQASRLGLFPPPLRATSSYDGRGRVPLNFELDTELDDLSRRLAEEGGRAFGIALQEGAQRLPTPGTPRCPAGWPGGG
jgi:hypothetical protein